jgi:hypothetical protein
MIGARGLGNAPGLRHGWDVVGEGMGMGKALLIGSEEFRENREKKEKVATTAGRLLDLAPIAPG